MKTVTYFDQNRHRMCALLSLLYLSQRRVQQLFRFHVSHRHVGVDSMIPPRDRPAAAAASSQVFLQSALLKHGQLDRCAATFAAALRSSSSASVLFGNEPVIVPLPSSPFLFRSTSSLLQKGPHVPRVLSNTREENLLSQVDPKRIVMKNSNLT